MLKKMKILPRKFYQRQTTKVAKDLLGKILVRIINGKILSGIITEVESYPSSDPASHAFKGLTKSNSALFGEVGHAYVYFIYGNYFCLNAVARNASQDGGGVLIRGLKPLEGIDIMIKNRGTSKLSNLTNGPGKLGRALKVTKELIGADLTKKGPIYITQGIKLKKGDVISTPRIGISKAKEKLLRFVIIKY